VIDKDATLARMLPGQPEVTLPAGGHASHVPAALLAGGVYAAAAALALVLTDASDAADRPGAPALADTAGLGNWEVQEGTLAIVVSNFGSDVNGTFADWTAAITFAEEPVDGSHGDVAVEVSIPSLTLGSVTREAMGPEYFNAEGFPTARYEARILQAETGYLAEGTLTLKGNTAPVSLPFTLEIEGDTARMTGSATLDRRNYEIGSGQTDEGTLGFTVDLNVDLTATRQ
jgi:polyisoprenoid-binding protein YceI